MPVEMSVPDFATRRVREIAAIVKPLRGKRRAGQTFCKLVSAQRHGQVVSTNDDLRRGDEYRDWRLKTFVDDFYFQYFELWRFATPKQDKLELFQAYLNVFRVNREVEAPKLEELICVHCDPLDKADYAVQDGLSRDEKERASSYKRGPHLHVKRSGDLTIPHSHFPLNLGHLDGVLASVQNLTQEIKRAVEVICAEVLMRAVRREHLSYSH